MGKVASRQPWTRMGVHVGRRGRCSPGPTFQEGCAYEHAVPGDGSWQCLQHKTSSSCLPLHRNLLYLKFPGVTRGPIDHFHMGGTALTSCIGVFAKRNPSTNGLAGLEAARFAGQSGEGGGGAGQQQEGKRGGWESLQLLIHWGKEQTGILASCQTTIPMPKGRVACCIS